MISANASTLCSSRCFFLFIFAHSLLTRKGISPQRRDSLLNCKTWRKIFNAKMCVSKTSAKKYKSEIQLKLTSSIYIKTLYIPDESHVLRRVKCNRLLLATAALHLSNLCANARSHVMQFLHPIIARYAYLIENGSKI